MVKLIKHNFFRRPLGRIFLYKMVKLTKRNFFRSPLGQIFFFFFFFLETLQTNYFSFCTTSPRLFTMYGKPLIGPTHSFNTHFSSWMWLWAMREQGIKDEVKFSESFLSGAVKWIEVQIWICTLLWTSTESLLPPWKGSAHKTWPSFYTHHSYIAQNSCNIQTGKRTDRHHVYRQCATSFTVPGLHQKK